MPTLPFSAYDFFGHLTTGALALIVVSALVGAPVLFGATVTTVEGVVLILAAYVLGQIIAAPAKLILEDWIAQKIVKSPAFFILAGAAARRREPRYMRSLDPAARAILLQRFDGGEGVKPTPESLFFHYRFHPALLANERLQSRLGLFLNQYGYHRNLSFACLVSSVLLWWPGPRCPIPGGALLPIGLSVAGLVLFARFLRFYRLYSLELFLTAVHDPQCR